jgi:hypothetical protein
MGNDYLQQEITNSSFLEHRDSKTLFGKLDFKLKDGTHIQNAENQYEFFRFIEENEGSLRRYYSDFFGVKLEFGGTGNEKYFYLDFNGSNRGNIDVDHRHFLKNEFVIIAFLIYKIIFIDGNFELTSVKKLQNTIKRDYEELRPGIYKLIAKIKKENVTQLNDEKVDQVVLESLYEFRKVGWITLEDDFFDVLPSFQRITKLYGEYINNIESWIKEQSK